MSPDLARHLQAPESLHALRGLVQSAGEEILRNYRSLNDTETAAREKTDGSPVTAADLAAHAVLNAGLPAILPGCPVVSEEDESSWVHRRDRGRYWLIDPLDGTREFLQRNGEFTVNVALIEDGQAVFGLVGRPTEQEVFWGGPGLGAWHLKEGAGPIRPLNTSATRFAESAAAALRVVVSRSHLDAYTQGFVLALGKAHAPLGGEALAARLGPALASSEVRGRSVLQVEAGSSLKFCALACGEADLYPRLAPTHEWDTAAAQAVLEGAGGAVLDPTGQALRYGKPESLNPWFIAAGAAHWIDAGMLSFLQEAAGQRSA